MRENWETAPVGNFICNPKIILWTCVSLSSPQCPECQPFLHQMLPLFTVLYHRGKGTYLSALPQLLRCISPAHPFLSCAQPTPGNAPCRYRLYPPKHKLSPHSPDVQLVLGKATSAVTQETKHSGGKGYISAYGIPDRARVSTGSFSAHIPSTISLSYQSLFTAAE